MVDANVNPNKLPPGDEVRILPPDRSIKKKIGENIDLNKVISPEKIEKAQEIIAVSRDEILQEIYTHIKTLELVYTHYFLVGDFSASAMKNVVDATFGIKSAAGMAGYSLASDVAKLFHNYLVGKNSVTSSDLKVIETAIGALKAIFSENIEGNGGKVGAELLGGLTVLINKYSG